MRHKRCHYCRYQNLCDTRSWYTPVGSVNPSTSQRRVDIAAIAAFQNIGLRISQIEKWSLPSKRTSAFSYDFAKSRQSSSSQPLASKVTGCSGCFNVKLRQVFVGKTGRCAVFANIHKTEFLSWTSPDRLQTRGHYRDQAVSGCLWA